jgi:integral membrane protein (TIGR01906 family)
MQVVKWALAVIAAVCVCIVLAVSAIQWVAFDLDFYWNMYYDQRTAERVGMSQDDLSRVTVEMLDYLNDVPGASFADITAVIDGEERPVFNDREITHMVDVKRLYTMARLVRDASCVVATACAVLLLVWMRTGAFRRLSAAYLIVLGVLIAGGAAIWALTRNNFSAFWERFHHVFFTNDLWILNPRTDLLIRMVPEEFFSTLVRRISVRLAGMAGFLAYTAMWVLIYPRKKQVAA